MSSEMAEQALHRLRQWAMQEVDAILGPVGMPQHERAKFAVALTSQPIGGIMDETVEKSIRRDAMTRNYFHLRAAMRREILREAKHWARPGGGYTRK